MTQCDGGAGSVAQRLDLTLGLGGVEKRRNQRKLLPGAARARLGIFRRTVLEEVRVLHGIQHLIGSQGNGFFSML